MKILTVSHYFESNGAGIEIVAAQIRKQLQKRGASVRWLAAICQNNVNNSKPSDEACVGIPMWDITRETSDMAWPIPPPTWITTFQREVKYADLIHLHEPFYPSSQICLWLAVCLRKPVVVTQHIADMPLAGFRSLAMALANLLLARPAHALARHVVFISERSRQFYLNSVRGKDIVIFNGCDTSIFYPIENSKRASLRNRLDLSPNRPVVLYVGRFIEKKGLHLLHKIAKRHDSLTFVFIGKGPIHPSTWNLSNVRVCQPLNHKELSHYYQAADVGILPAVGEGFPLVVQEALCCGLPMVVSNEIADACPDLRNEFLCAGPGGLQSGCVLCQYLYNPFSELDRFNLANKVAPRWSWDRCGESYYNLFEKILHKTK